MQLGSDNQLIIRIRTSFTTAVYSSTLLNKTHQDRITMRE